MVENNEVVCVESAEQKVVPERTPKNQKRGSRAKDGKPGERHAEPDDCPQDPKTNLAVQISGSLFQKLRSQAHDEGLALAEYVSELLSESVTMRAWEIMERKFQMRNANGSNAGNSSNRHGGGRWDRGRKGGSMSQSRYQNIMDDKASFLEYVRSQERSKR